MKQIELFVFSQERNNGQRVLLSAVGQPSVAPLAWMLQTEPPENEYCRNCRVDCSAQFNITTLYINRLLNACDYLNKSFK